MSRGMSLLRSAEITIEGGRGRRTGIVRVVGISVALGALLVLTTLPVVTSAVGLELHAVAATSDPTCFTGGHPRDPGYDPVTHEVYVPNEGSPGLPNITVYSQTCQLVGTISLPSNSIPWQAAFDPSNNYMFVTDYGLNEVYVISGTTIVHTITGLDGPEGVTFDYGLVSMDVVSSGGDNVSAWTGAGEFDTSFATGSDPSGILYDPGCACEFVTNSGSDSVTVIETATNTFRTVSLTVGKSPEGIGYDPNDGGVYVANAGSNNVSVLNTVGGTVGVYGSIAGFNQPAAVAWDQASAYIYVANEANGKVVVVSGDSIVKKYSTASDSHAIGLAYDEFNDDMYVTGFNTNLLYVLS